MVGLVESVVRGGGAPAAIRVSLDEAMDDRDDRWDRLRDIEQIYNRVSRIFNAIFWTIQLNFPQNISFILS